MCRKRSFTGWSATPLAFIRTGSTVRAAGVSLEFRGLCESKRCLQGLLCSPMNAALKERETHVQLPNPHSSPSVGLGEPVDAGRHHQLVLPDLLLQEGLQLVDVHLRDDGARGHEHA